MKTEHLINYSRKEIQEFYEQGIITSDQYEAFDYVWSNAQFRYSNTFPYRWSNLVQSARVEFWKIYHALPKDVQKRLHTSIAKNAPYYW